MPNPKETQPVRYELTPAELKLIETLKAQFADVQRQMQQQYATTLSTVIQLRELPPVAGGYALSDDGLALIPAIQAQAS